MIDRSRFRLRLGLRGEVVIIFPVAVLLLVVLAAFTAFAYREALERIAEERRAGAERLARRIAELLEARGEAPASELRSLALDLESVALYGPDGRLLTRVGGPSAPPPAVTLPTVGPTASGPSAELAGRIVALAPLGGDAGRGAVRIETDAAALWAASSSLRVLLPVVLGLGGSLALLVVLFLGRLLGPYDSLIREARRAGLLEPDDPGEIASLIRGFERAVAVSRLPAGRPDAPEGSPPAEPGDPLAAVERALATELQAGLLLVDPEGRPLALNPEGARLLGVSAPAPGQALADLLAPLPELAAPLVAAVAAGRAIERTEVVLRRPAGALTLGLALHPLRRPDGSPRGYLALFSDLTRFEQLAGERRMSESLAQLGELSAGVAHELRNSLGVLRGYLDLLRDEPDPDVASDYRAELLAETARLQSVVDDFLAFARPGARRLEPVDLSALVVRVAADPALASCGVRTDLPVPPPPLLRGDPVLLERAVRNLARNAAGAHLSTPDPPGEPVRLAVEPTAEGWAVLVEDRGPGLPAEVRARLFQPFVSGRGGGTGLGLALTYRIVSLHGGTLEVEDRAGGGTRARIAFRRDAFATEGNTPPATDAGDASIAQR